MKFKHFINIKKIVKIKEVSCLTRISMKGPGLIRGIFGLRFSEKVQFPVLFGLYSHHKGNIPQLQNSSSNICFDVLSCHGNVDNHSENAIFQYFPHFTAIFGALN